MVLGSRASHFIEEIMKMYGDECIFNDSGLSPLPLQWRSHAKCMKSMYFQWFGASHASHSTEEIIQNWWKSMLSNDSGLPTLPTPPRKAWKWMEINAFSMSLGSHATKEIMTMYGNQYIFNDAGLPTLPTPPKKSWKCWYPNEALNQIQTNINKYIQIRVNTKHIQILTNVNQIHKF